MVILPSMKTFALAMMSLALAACTAPKPVIAESVDPIAHGRQIAERYCASCHAIGSQGESRNPLSPPFRELSRNYPLTALEEAFAEGILVGHPDMPDFELTPKQNEDLLDYMQSIQERQGG
jgi:mono/diheme cytochrome c family protein